MVMVFRVVRVMWFELGLGLVFDNLIGEPRVYFVLSVDLTHWDARGQLCRVCSRFAPDFRTVSVGRACQR